MRIQSGAFESLSRWDSKCLTFCILIPHLSEKWASLKLRSSVILLNKNFLKLKLKFCTFGFFPEFVYFQWLAWNPNFPAKMLMYLLFFLFCILHHRIIIIIIYGETALNIWPHYFEENILVSVNSLTLFWTNNSVCFDP